MNIRSITGRSAIVIAAIAMIAVSPATALASTTPDDGEFGIAVEVNGEITQFTDDEISSMLNEPAVSVTNPDAGNLGPYLIDFPAWSLCFTFNNEEIVFAEWNFAWNGALNPVRLKCGNASWGYKHIQAGKESDWLAQLNKAKTYGWDGTGMGVNGWDDLMALGTGTTLSYAADVRTKAASNTRCAVGTILLMKGSSILYSFNTRVGFATNNDRLLTSFPQSSNKCPTTDGWV